MNRPTFNAMLAQYKKPTIEGEGAVSWENGARCVIPEVVVGGKAEQEQYTGVNLFFRIPEQTLNGVTLTHLEDGGYLLNGTCTAHNNILVGADLKAGRYSLGCRYEGKLPDNANARAQVYVASPYFSPMILNNSKVDEVSVGTLAADGRATFRIRIEAGFTYNNVKFWPMFVLGDYAAATMPDYEPYTGGIPAPNPNYPIMPTFSEGTTVVSRGKNLANVGNEYRSWGSGIYTTVVRKLPEADKPYTRSTLIPVRGGETYNATWKGTTYNGRFFFYDREPVVDETMSIGGSYFPKELPSVTFTTPENSKWLLFVFHTVTSDRVEPDITDMQIELGTTSTSYTPYFDGGTAVAPIPLLQAVDGSWQSTWDPQTGKGLNWWWDMIELDGSEPWYTYPGWTGFRSGIDTLPEQMIRNAYWCNMALPKKKGDAGVLGGEIGLWCGVNNGVIYVVNNPFYDETLSDSGLANWKAHLAANPLKIWVARNEPVEFQTDPQPLIQPPGVGHILQTDGTLDNCPITVTPVTHQ